MLGRQPDPGCQNRQSMRELGLIMRGFATAGLYSIG